jgi:hypothetical protein
VGTLKGFEGREKENRELLILWTSGDREVALSMVFMYVLNAKTRGWWEEIRLVVWGPSGRILAQDQDLQIYMEKIIEAGVRVEACRACTDSYGVSEKLEGMGIEVKYMGEPFTEMLKRGEKVLAL